MHKIIDINLHIGHRLREKRKKTGLEFTTICDVVNLTYQQIQKYENGQIRIPVNKLYEFSNLYQVPIQYFFEDVDDSQPEDSLQTTLPMAPEENRHLNILLIEDNPVDEFFTRKTIASIDPEILLFCVHNERQAMDFLKNRMNTPLPFLRPDLIFMDILVSKKEAHMLLTSIKHDHSLKEIPMIILTSTINKADMLKSYRGGAASFIRKTSNLEEFTNNMRICLEYWCSVVILPTADLLEKMEPILPRTEEKIEAREKQISEEEYWIDDSESIETGLITSIPNTGEDS